MVLEVRAALTVRFWEYFIKQKMKNPFDLVGAGLVRSGAGPAASLSARERTAGMVSWPIGLKLGRCVVQFPQFRANQPQPPGVTVVAKRVTAPKGLLPGVIPEQHKFVPARQDASNTIIVYANK